MAGAVVERCIAHIAALDRQPACGDVDAAALCRAMREPAPRAGRGARAAARRAVPRLDPAVVHRPVAWLPRVHSGRRDFSGGARRLHHQHDQPLHRRLAGRAGARAARGQRPRLAARLDGIPGGSARPVHHRRLDGHLQRHRLRARTAPRRRDPARRAVHLRSGAPLGAEVGEARRRHAGSRARDRVRRSVPAARRPAARDRSPRIAAPA